MDKSTTILFQKTRKLYLLTVVFFSISNIFSNECYSLNSIKISELSEIQNQTFYLQNKAPKATILIVHGLNLIPSSFNQLAKDLYNNGNSVLRLSLAGSTKSEVDKKLKKSYLLKSWKQDIRCALLKMNQIHAETKKPIKSISQSLGSLLIYWASLVEKVRFHQHVFLAPALKVKWIFSLHKSLFFLNDDFEIPSKNLPEYSSYPFTSLGEYRSVQSLLSELKKREKAPLNLTVFLNPKDELVHYADSMKFFKSLKSTIIIAKKGANSIGAEHLFVDAKTAGDPLYKRIKSSLE